MVFETMYFSDCSLDSLFFDSLRNDYPGFDEWFKEKSEGGATAHIYLEGEMIQGFLYVKDYECEAVGGLPESPRMKIGTFKVCEDVARRRIAEGAIGIALWKWQLSELDEIYTTVFPKHAVTIKLLKMFGFRYGGKKGEEEVYFKNKRELDYSDPKSSFPFIDPKFSVGRYISIDDIYHDQMFQYSDLKNTQQIRGDFPVSNGITKNFIATPSSTLNHTSGDIAFIYRKHTGTGSKWHKSVVTSFCTITKVTPIKISGRPFYTYDHFIRMTGNKVVLTTDQLKERYRHSNVYLIEMIYNGYFGAGNNITCGTLTDNNLFGGAHPYEIALSRENVLKIFELGGKSEHDIIVDKP